MTSKGYPSVNKIDLLKILDTLKYYEPKKSMRLMKAETDADKATTRFLRSCKEYQRLQAVATKARRANKKYREAGKRQFYKNKQRYRQAIYLDGPVPKTVNLIRAFLKKYPT